MAKQPTLPPEVTIAEESSDSVAKRTFISLSVALAFFLLLGFLYQIRVVLVWLFIALVIALALSPLVNWLINHGWKRVWASLAAILATLVIIFGTLSAVASPLISQGSSLADQFPKFIENSSQNPTLQKLDERFGIVEKVKQSSQQLPAALTGTDSSVLKTAQNTLNVVVAFGAILTLAFFMLVDGPSSWQKSTALLKPRHAARVNHVGERISTAISGYVTGNLFISLIAGLVTLITLLLLGVPYAIPLAVLVAVFDLIPLIGATIAMVIVAIVALSVSPLTALIVVLVLLIYQGIEGNVIQPVVYSRTVKLSELLILVASIIGATLGGIVGVLLAIPAASAVQIIIVELLRGTAPGKRAKLHEN